ncbi:MAG TPA: cupredoxin domain-containing protein [Nitrospirales bacterium]|nr:cupredoxin domain-containing protein [Nitrospirales bacterium]
MVGRSLALGTGLLVLQPIITCAAAEPFAFEVPLDQDGIQRAVVEADSYSFTPSHLVVKAGKPVELTFKSVTLIVPHNIVIDDPRSGLAIREGIPAGENVTVKFTPAVQGSFAIYCDKKLLFFKSHREKGMEGVLEVR